MRTHTVNAMVICQPIFRSSCAVRMWLIMQDLHAYFSVVHIFVSSYVDLYYDDLQSLQADTDLAQFWTSLNIGATFSSDTNQEGWGALNSKEKLKDTLALFIMAVTGMHQHLGNVNRYLSSSIAIIIQ